MRNYVIVLTLLISMLSSNFAFCQSEEYGIASFYDDSFQGAKTSSGEAYDKDKYTGAHKKLPFGTIVRVTRLDTKESVKIRINDRGPYIKGRIIELSKRAAQKIDLVKAGVSRVKVEVLGNGVVPDEFSGTSAGKSPIPPAEVIIAEPERPKVNKTRPDKDKIKTNVKATPKQKTDKTAVTQSEVPETSAPAQASKVPPAKPLPVSETAKRVKGSDFKTYDLYKVQILRPEKSGFGVQVASLSNYANVMKQVAELQEKWFKNILISVEKGAKDQPVYKILLGPFPDRATAKSYEKDLKRKKKIDGFIVDLSTVKY